MGFAAGFLAGSQAARNGIDVYNQAKDRERLEKKQAELEGVANAKPEESQGFTAEQGAQLEAAAQSGQYDIGIKYKDDGSFDSYTATPKADPTQTGNVAMQGVTDFMGQRTAGSMSSDQISNARQNAAADVIGKYDPQEGMRMRREIKNQEREDQRFSREQKRWGQEDEADEKEKTYQSKLQEAYSNSRYGQNQSAHQKQMQEFQSKMDKYNADKAAGKSGPELGVPPVAPNAPEYSVGDALADRAALVDLQAKSGKLDPKAFGEFTDMLNKVQSEGYEKVLRLAQGGAPIQEVAQAFNASGKVQFDPAAVVSDKMVKGKDGVETRVIQFKDEDGSIRTINALAELDSMGKAADVFTRHFQVRQDQRATNAEGRAASNFATEQRDTAALRAAQAELERASQSGDPAAINAARIRVVEAGGKISEGGGKDEPADLQMARAALQARVPGVKDMAGALEWVRTSKGKSMTDVRADIYGKALVAKLGDTKEAQRETDAAMEYLFPQVAAEDQAQPGNNSNSKTGPSKALSSVSQKAVGEAQGYLSNATTQEDFNKRVQDLKKKGWSDDQIRALVR